MTHTIEIIWRYNFIFWLLLIFNMFFICSITRYQFLASSLK